MDTHWCITTLTRIVSDLVNYDSGRRIGGDLLDVYHVQLELVYRELIGMEVLGGLFIQEALRIVMLLEGDKLMEMGYHAPVIHDGNAMRMAKLMA